MDEFAHYWKPAFKYVIREVTTSQNLYQKLTKFRFFQPNLYEILSNLYQKLHHWLTPQRNCSQIFNGTTRRECNHYRLLSLKYILYNIHGAIRDKHFLFTCMILDTRLHWIYCGLIEKMSASGLSSIRSVWWNSINYIFFTQKHTRECYLRPGIRIYI